MSPAPIAAKSPSGSNKTNPPYRCISLPASAWTVPAGISRHRSFRYGILKNPDGSRTCTDPQGRKYLTERLDDLLFGKMPVTSYVPKEDGQGGFVYDDTDTACHPLDGYGLYCTDPQKVADVDITLCHTPTTGVLGNLTAGSAWTVPGTYRGQSTLWVQSGRLHNGPSPLEGLFRCFLPWENDLQSHGGSV